VELTNISKAFYGVQALSNVQLSLRPGEVNCLVGENGAGKSTLIKILAGEYIPDSGTIELDSVAKKFYSPRDSQKSKIAVMHQELMLVPELTVAENIVLGKWPKRAMLTDRKRMKTLAAELLEKLGSSIDPDAKVSELSTGQQQMVEVARALSQNIEVLIMDEPTAALSDADSKILLNIVRTLRSQGMAILYVSHRLEEVFEIADRITVFRDGKFVGCEARSALSPDEIVRMMVGRDVNVSKHKREVRAGEKVLEVKNLCGKNFNNISFDLHEGEVLGLAGLVGAGRTEILRAIFGEDRLHSGEIKVFGKARAIKHPRAAMGMGLSLVPEDRKTQGLSLDHSVRENITIAVLKRFSRGGIVRAKLQEGAANEYKDRLRIKTASLSTMVTYLSGGNQQKVVLARSLITNPKILLLDEPTRGVDVGAREEIHKIIEEAVKDKMAILLVCSDLIELMALSDRLIVLKEGSITKVSDNDMSKEEVLKFAAV